MNDSQVTFAASGSVTTMTVATGCGCRNRSVSGSLNCVVTVTAIKFQLAGMKLVTKRDRLLWLMSNVDDCWMDCSKQTRCQVTANGYGSRHQ